MKKGIGFVCTENELREVKSHVGLVFLVSQRLISPDPDFVSKVRFVSFDDLVLISSL